MRQKVAGSLKTKIPNKTVPTAPMPVHTAYAVPIGSVFVVFIKRSILIERQTTNARNHHTDSFPCVLLALAKHAAKPTSKRPAIIKYIHCIISKLVYLKIVFVGIVIANLNGIN